MKKILFCTMILSFIFVPCKAQNLIGKVSFKTDSTWLVGSQTWSDVVMATGCKKNTFTGAIFGHTVTNLADCRQNSGYGDLFSWEMVNKHKGLLCPDGWRIPTKEDFAKLDVELRVTGTGQDAYVDAIVRDKYLNLWGGAYGGYCDPDGDLHAQGSVAFYWSQPEDGAGSACVLYFDTDGSITPQLLGSRDPGFTLRCVR